MPGARGADALVYDVVGSGYVERSVCLVGVGATKIFFCRFWAEGERGRRG